eukprot:CAMPEP_0172504060 /NCGR_PEP_ID=MMETSP1066-20121228/174927_1 /TAXON_ID=671091 /ORGANISM="Coscinodiscus wailesii, Strain CCMP2513" /LENGTH=741 /DNA_ID=CAMNT_0013280057 /DNA_START=712 /DNA_END=2937 /DNA_ORIENTATION=+
MNGTRKQSRSKHRKKSSSASQSAASTASHYSDIPSLDGDDSPGSNRTHETTPAGAASSVSTISVSKASGTARMIHRTNSGTGSTVASSTMNNGDATFGFSSHRGGGAGGSVAQAEYYQQQHPGGSSQQQHHNTPLDFAIARITSDKQVDDDKRSQTGSSIIHDETVKVNLAMADLMAYLQVVANNSSNLPLTTRDDPELGRTVSTLTAEEYARKSAAFLPSDVKIISGSFMKYGRVWDLPTSEEFNPSDSTQEPGISHGGACCNALLKVLYDNESEAAEAAQVDYTNAANLFDDEDDDAEDEDGGHSAVDASSKSFDSLVLGDITTPATITWTDLLRKMRIEMMGVGFTQSPAITSSRKFDMNTAFSLIPPNFDPTKNKKRSLLIGCNYKGNPEAELKASHDDIRSMKDFIVNVHGFPEAKGLMTVLLDDDDHKHPTHLNITEAFKALSEQSQPGDAVFIQFSGHGCRILDSPIDADVESYDEAIIPSDYKVSGMIRDILIFKTLLAPMRYGVSVTLLLDCCDTGVMVDLPYSWSTKMDRMDVVAKMSLNDDFSFVRFLKVIKTLYESSTFTQLGRTVRSVLNEKSPTAKDYEEEEEEQTLLDDSTIGGGSLVTLESEADGGITQTTKKTASTFMNVLTACHSPKTSSPRRDLNKNYSHASEANKQKDTQLDAPSLFQQVINCAFNNPAESDDDTFHPNNTEDEDHSYAAHTEDYDSITDDGMSREYAQRSSAGRRFVGAR